jgi:hypothetical protein
MLPKPEKNKKSNSVVETEEQVKSNDAQLAKKRLQTKRRLILLSLFLTVGLSFIFWSFRHIQAILVSPPKFSLNLKINLPQFSHQPSIKNTNSSADLDKYIKSLSQNWSVLVSSVSAPETPIYQYHAESISKDNLSDIIKNLSSKKTDAQSLVDLNLPQGLLFQESFSPDQNFTYQNIISLPQNKLLFLIKIDNPKNLDQAKKELPLLIDKIYWYSVSQLN